jgi:Predicted permeases
MASLLKALRGRQSEAEWRACGLLLACALAFSLMTVCVKHLGGRLPVAEIVLVRSVISLAITLAMLRQAQISPWGQQRPLLVLRGALGTGALLLFFEALARLPLAAATLIQYTYPTLTALTAWLLLGEPLRKRIGLAVLLGWLGVTLVVQPEWMGETVRTAQLSL